MLLRNWGRHNDRENMVSDPWKTTPFHGCPFPLLPVVDCRLQNRWSPDSSRLSDARFEATETGDEFRAVPMSGCTSLVARAGRLDYPAPELSA